MSIKRYGKSLRIRLDPELLTLLKESAKDNERTVNAEIAYCLKKYLIPVPSIREVSSAELKRLEKMTSEAKPLVILSASIPDVDEEAVSMTI